MCVMEIHAGASEATMFQAEWHNTATLISDADMLCGILEARGHLEEVLRVREAQETLRQANTAFLALFTEAAARVPVHELAHAHARGARVGQERTLEDIERAATRQARRDETR
jgi:hypothetical protein